MHSGRGESEYPGGGFWTRVIPVALVLFLLLPWTAASPAGGPDDLEVRVGNTVEITASRRYCWFPTVHQFSTGEIMATMRMSPDEVNPEGDFSAYCLSKDGGLTWSPRYTMGAGANVDGAYSDARPDGSILQLYGWVDSLVREPTTELRLTSTNFWPGGMGFTQRRDVPLRTSQPIHLSSTQLYDRKIQDGHLSAEPVFVPWGPIIEALNGDLMAPVYYTADRDARYYRLALIRSHDGGKSWSEYSTIAAVEPGEQPWPGMGGEGPCEAGIVRLADQRLYAIFRTGGDGFIANAWSADDGKTWTKPRSTPYKGVALRVRRLSNGVLACTTGRPGPVVVFCKHRHPGREHGAIVGLILICQLGEQVAIVSAHYLLLRSEVKKPFETPVHEKITALQVLEKDDGRRIVQNGLQALGFAANKREARTFAFGGQGDSLPNSSPLHSWGSE